MNKFYLTVFAIIAVLFIGIMVIQGSKNTQKQILEPSSQLPQEGTPTPIDTTSILNGTTPAPTNTPVPTLPPPTPTSKPISATKATIVTSQGNIVLELYPQDAPNTVSNFAQKAQSGYYNGFDFHRVENWVIQGGDPKGDGSGGNDTLIAEYNNRPFVAGSLGVARKNDPRINNDSQFFITKIDSPSLNGQYTNFGIVTEGVDLVNRIVIRDKILKITVE